MAIKSKHAFGSESNIKTALEKGLVDSYDILFLNEGKIGWIDRDGKPVILEDKTGVETVDTLPETGDEKTIYIYDGNFYFWNGTEFAKPECIGVEESVVNEKVASAVKEAKTYTDDIIDNAVHEFEATCERIKYEITSKPVGTLVNYSEKEIRVMCPADTQWVKQTVGVTGNANMYYMGFKAYAPDGAVSFKEGDRGVIIDEMFTFDSDFAGTDEFGRNYSICWLALASYDEKTDTWTYFGKNSTSSKYIGWDYVVEWYDVNGIIIESDFIRINLSNEECHSSTKPYYVDGVIDEANAYTDEQIANAVGIIEF